MQFFVDPTPDHQQFQVTCQECVSTVEFIPSAAHQAISDSVNKHAFMSHGVQKYASAHFSEASTPEHPGRVSVFLAATPTEKPAPAAEPEVEEPVTEEEDDLQIDALEEEQ